MPAKPSSHFCPDCGSPLPPGSPRLLCAACLLRQAMVSQTLATDGKPALVSAPPSPEEIAGRFPGFEILECLGRGGMGVVYKARQKSLDRVVAIKILAPEKHGEERFATRFAREAATLAKLNHPNIVTIHDFGETGGWFYIVMEYVEGVNLRDLVSEGKLAPEQALAIVPPICDALQYAHEQGVVHRDIKPENILLDRGGRVRIADFGIAALMGGSGEPAGTPPYAAPEQTRPDAIADHRADIHALGVVFYEMLTGERPTAEMMAPSGRAGTDRRLDDMVLRAMAKDPAERFQTAAEFRTAVEALGEEPVFAREQSRWRKWAHPAATVALLGAVGFLLWKQSHPAPQVAKPATAENQAPVDVATMRLDDSKALWEMKLTPEQAADLLKRADKEVPGVQARSKFHSGVIGNLCRNGQAEDGWRLIHPEAGIVRKSGLHAWFTFGTRSPALRYKRLETLKEREDRETALRAIFKNVDVGQVCELDFESIVFMFPEERSKAVLSLAAMFDYQPVPPAADERRRFLARMLELGSTGWLSEQEVVRIFHSVGGNGSFDQWDLLERVEKKLPGKLHAELLGAVVANMAVEDPERAIRQLAVKLPPEGRFRLFYAICQRMWADGPLTCEKRVEALLPDFDEIAREQLSECVVRMALASLDFELAKKWMERISTPSTRKDLNDAFVWTEEKRKRRIEESSLDRGITPSDLPPLRPYSNREYIFDPEPP